MTYVSFQQLRLDNNQPHFTDLKLEKNNPFLFYEKKKKDILTFITEWQWQGKQIKFKAGTVALIS